MAEEAKVQKVQAVEIEKEAGMPNVKLEGDQEKIDYHEFLKWSSSCRFGHSRASEA